VPATCPYTEPARPSPYPPTLLPEDPSEYYPSTYGWVFQVTTIIRRVILQKGEDLIYTAEEAWNHTCTVVTDRVSDIQVDRVKTKRIEQATAIEQHLWKKCIQTRQNVRHDQPNNNCYWQPRSCPQWANLEANSCASTKIIRGILLKSLQKYGFSKEYLKENLVSFATLRRNNIKSCRTTSSTVDEVAGLKSFTYSVMNLIVL